jgi:threonine dehydrogenase-like Zn-dependent dehydrogenase
MISPWTRPGSEVVHGLKIAVVTGPGSVELREEQLGALAADHLSVEIAACGLCTMERRLFTGEKAIYPVAPGHEAAGHVAEVGAAIDVVPGVPGVGDLVAVDLWDRCGVCRPCRRGRSAVCTRPQAAQLSDGTIAMGEPVACAVHSVRHSGLRAGTPGAVERAMDLVADGGTVVLYGASPKDLVAQVAPDAIHHHEISVVGVLNQEPEDWRTAAGLISAGTIAADLDALVTARFGLADVSAAFEHATGNPVFRVLVARRHRDRGRGFRGRPHR